MERNWNNAKDQATCHITKKVRAGCGVSSRLSIWAKWPLVGRNGWKGFNFTHMYTSDSAGRTFVSPIGFWGRIQLHGLYNTIIRLLWEYLICEVTQGYCETTPRQVRWRWMSRDYQWNQMNIEQPTQFPLTSIFDKYLIKPSQTPEQRLLFSSHNI